MRIFDRNLVRRHLQRAETMAQDPFIWRHCAAGVQDRLMDIKRDFGTVVEIAPQRLVLTPPFLAQKKIAHTHYVSPLKNIDEEIWPFAAQSLEAIFSVGHLHWINDVPGVLAQFKNALRPDGVFLCSFIGGETLRELRASLAQVEMEIYGGVSPRVSPFITLPDMAALMQRAQFALPVVDNDLVTVSYANIGTMIADLRRMGQTNAVIKRDRKILSKDFWPRVEAFYRGQFSDERGRLTATVEIIYALGWAPDASQPQPLKRGSATHSLVDVLKHNSK